MRLKTVALIVSVALVCGCQQREVRRPEYETLVEDPTRDTEGSRRKNAEALRQVEEGNLAEAEKTLKDALAADLFYGPAHNNLGVVYYRQEKYYMAAWEFQYAAKAMPYSPEPRNNLGLVYETVGRLKEAEAWYDKALSLQPDNPELMGSLCRIRVRNGVRDEKTHRLLEELALKAVRPEWAKWARDQLALMQEPRAGGDTAAEDAPQAPRSAPGALGENDHD